MHDFHLAEQIVKIARQHAQIHGLDKIEKIVIELGNIIEHNESILPENLEFNIRLILPGIKKVEIKKISGNTWKLVNIEGK
jgi:Zn finger protein HypA/HybF involved in hydrogenase expression